MSSTFILRRYFVTSGVGLSRVSHLNSFDRALRNAGISEYNLVPVSSILPVNAQEIPRRELEPGTIIFVVLARHDGYDGELIAAGVGVGKVVRSDGKRYGLVAEAHGPYTRDEIERIVKERLEEMARIREVTMEEVKTETVSMVVPENTYGTVIAAVVLVPED